MRDKYSGLQIGIHWLVFLLVVVAYAAMELRGFFPRSDRLKSPAPPIVPKPSPMMTGFAHLGHLVIYLLFIALPLIGMVMMYWRGNPWYAFGLTMPYAPQSDFERVDTLKAIHEWLANAGYFVIGLHALAALVHHYWWKDNTLLRMMPRKR